MTIKCLNCGSTAQMKKIGSVENDNTIIEIYECGCGARVERILNVSSITHWSPLGTCLKTIRAEKNKKIFKNPLTKPSKCDIIYAQRKERGKSK